MVGVKQHLCPGIGDHAPASGVSRKFRTPQQRVVQLPEEPMTASLLQREADVIETLCFLQNAFRKRRTVKIDISKSSFLTS